MFSSLSFFSCSAFSLFIISSCPALLSFFLHLHSFPMHSGFIFQCSQSLLEAVPELWPPVVFLRPLQVGGGTHEFAQFAEAFGDVVFAQRLQQDQDDSVSIGVAVKELEVGEVQFVATPIGLEEVLRQDEDGPSAALYRAYDVIHNPVTREKVPFVEAQRQRPKGSGIHLIFTGVPWLLQLRYQEVLHPASIPLTVGNEGIKG